LIEFLRDLFDFLLNVPHCAHVPGEVLLRAHQVFLLLLLLSLGIHLRLALLTLNDLIDDRLVLIDAIDFEVLRQNNALALNLLFQGFEELIVDSVLSGFFLHGILFFELHILLCVHTSEEFRGIEVDWGFDLLSFLFFFLLTAEIWRIWLIRVFRCHSTWVLSRGSAIAVITTTRIALLFLFAALLFLTIFVTIVFFPVLVILRIFSAVIIIRVFVVVFSFLVFFAVLIAIFKSVVVPNERFRLILG